MSELTAQLIPLSKLRESGDNPRKLFGNLNELADSLRSQGMLQPAVARRNAEGDLEVVIGHRRFRAAKLAGLKTMPVFVREMSRQQALEAMLVENKQREDVNALELADGYAKLMNDFNLSADDVADRVGVSRSSVYTATSLLDLMEPAKKALLQGKITASGAIEIVKVHGERLQLQALADAMKLSKNGEPPSARAIQRLVRSKYLSTPKGGVSKRQREEREHGADVALRKRVLVRLLGRIAELVERKPNLDETDLRTAAIALAEVGGEAARQVFVRRGLRPDRLKIGATQLRSLLVELALASWLRLDAEGDYEPAVKATAKAYGLSLSELSANVENESAANALFEKN